MWPLLLLLPSALSSLDSDTRFDYAVRDVALVCFVYFLQAMHIPFARTIFVSLASYSLLSEMVDDLTYKLVEPNARHAMNWKVVQENNMYYALDRLVKQRENDHHRPDHLRTDVLDHAIQTQADREVPNLRVKTDVL
jgi:hypothetical protein